MTDLKDIQNLAKLFIQAQEDVARLEGLLSDAKKHLSYLSRNLIPDTMEELNLKNITTEGGISMKVDAKITAKISEANMPKVVSWLREHKHEKIIKSIILISPKNDAHTQSLDQELAEDGIDHEVKSSIHAQTLKAFVRGQLEAGVDIPFDLFGIYTWNETEVLY